MRLTAHSDYALRVLIYAGLRGDRPCRVEDIARHYKISNSHLTKVVWHLANAEFLVTTRGRNGGIRLAKSPEETNLGGVLRALEDNTSLVECFGAKGACVITPACAARRMFREGLEAFFAVFDRYTLADLLKRRTGLIDALQLETV